MLKRYAKTATGRIGAGAALRALSVLVRHHPKAALDIAGAGLAQAGRLGFQEIKTAILPASASEGPAATSLAGEADTASKRESR